MKVLILGNQPTAIGRIIEEGGDEVMEWRHPIDVPYLKGNKFEMVISYGYRHLIRKPIIDYLQGRIINLHISYLPWNRGADPNLWSFLEDTPKGVSIHCVDCEIDTGDIIAQKEIDFNEDKETLSSSYSILHGAMAALFRTEWPAIRNGFFKRRRQPAGGSLHKLSEKNDYEHLLIKGWNTPVHFLKGRALAEAKEGWNRPVHFLRGRAFAGGKQGAEIRAGL